MRASAHSGALWRLPRHLVRRRGVCTRSAKHRRLQCSAAIGQRDARRVPVPHQVEPPAARSGRDVDDRGVDLAGARVGGLCHDRRGRGGCVRMHRDAPRCSDPCHHAVLSQSKGSCWTGWDDRSGTDSPTGSPPRPRSGSGRMARAAGRPAPKRSRPAVPPRESRCRRSPLRWWSAPWEALTPTRRIGAQTIRNPGSSRVTCLCIPRSAGRCRRSRRNAAWPAVCRRSAARTRERAPARRLPVSLLQLSAELALITGGPTASIRPTQRQRMSAIRRAPMRRCAAPTGT